MEDKLCDKGMSQWVTLPISTLQQLVLALLIDKCPPQMW
ncbi:unnamed protein product [Onchocerca flexuosa]|uniref:Uncharacterized protein n=1 Tax=Onchocerca flexuosa TaxID=387005 RepID=A0A183HWL0_9BILA|nr:unnamed protein product [Onchocerca flexuosa]